jgi:hypothetical protein
VAKNLTVRASVVIDAPRERVWDYTQDWTRRTEWDALILDATVLDGEPRRVRVTARGATFLVKYKLTDRPRKTSLVMTELRSRWFSGGGGSWTYEELDGATRWTQTNTVTLRSGLVRLVLGWLVRWQLARATRRAMRTAKRRLDETRVAPPRGEARRLTTAGDAGE